MLENGVSSTVEAIDQVVNRSHAENLKAAAPAAKPVTVRAGGRPRKDGSPNKATLRKMQELLANGSPELEAKKIDSPQTESNGSAIGPTAPSPRPIADFPDVAVKALLKSPFQLARAVTGFPGFVLEDAAAAELTPVAQECIRIYLPDTDSKHAPAIALLIGLGSIFAVQTQQYRQWKAEGGDQVETKPHVQGVA